MPRAPDSKERELQIDIRAGGARARGAPRGFALLMMLFGLGLAVPGGMLLSLGGSPYYLTAGIAAALCALLLWRGDGRAVSVYAAVLAATLLWALWESGWDAWALLPRLGVPIAFGLWLLTPFAHRGLRGRTGAARGMIGAASLSGIALLLLGLASPKSPVPESTLATANVPATAQAPATPDADAIRADGEWPEYGRDRAGTRFSPLAQITRENVAQLQLAWTYRLGIPKGLRVALEVTPLKIGDRLYLCAANSDVIALDAETGRQVWRFLANADATGVFAGTCRGVAYYRVPDGSGPCPERILSTTMDRRLLALNARDGARCADFGNGGEVSLDTGMGSYEPGYYRVTSAPQVIRGNVVFGGWVTDGQYVGEPSGVIRAFNAVTGKLAWAWDLGRPGKTGEPAAGETYTPGTPNSWAPISADEELGLVYLPTGNATPDYVGSHRRPFDDQYSSSVVALDAQTGAVRWSFQTTHHDLWDYDVPSQPTLVDLPDGSKALLQPTKRGELFLLDRRTGVPLAAVEERPAPATTVPGERTAPTQPFSVGMPSFAGPPPSEARMWGVTPFDQLWCRIKFRQARFDGTLTPVGVDRPTLVYPGYLGGMNWGGVSVDTDRALAIVNSVRVFNYDQLLTRAQADALGLKPISASHPGDVGGPVAQMGTAYAASIRPFLSPLIVPCSQPPYGMLSAVDLRTRKLRWSRPLGVADRIGPLTIASHLPFTVGLPNIGGAVTTRSGLTFIGATQDGYLRAIDTAAGRELWRVRLPAGGQATPMSYWSEASGRQFVLIAAGGNGAILAREGDYIVAYALPKR
jgi:quinoprotein glucose dehydrogenase